MISSIQYLPLVKQGFFLRQKYVVEKLSPQEIAVQTFSSKLTVLRYLTVNGIALRAEDRRPVGGQRFGLTWRRGRIVIEKRERAAIEKMKTLRLQGLTLDQIADVMNAVGMPTKTGRSKWTSGHICQIL